MDQCREDSQHGLPYMLGGRDPVGGGIWEKDEGGGTNIPGTLERKGPVRGLRNRDCGGIIGVKQGDSAWAGGRGAVDLGASATGGEPPTYRMAFPTKGGPRSCPAEGCPGRAGTRTATRMNFFNRHVRDILIILEEGNLPHPQCPPMRHAGTMEGSKQQAPCHHTVRKGRGTKEASDGGDSVEG